MSFVPEQGRATTLPARTGQEHKHIALQNALQVLASGPELDRPDAPDAYSARTAYSDRLATSEFYHDFHTDAETPDTVPWTGLEATTRAYAKVIDEVNKLPLSDLQGPEEPMPAARPTPPAARD